MTLRRSSGPSARSGGMTDTGVLTVGVDIGGTKIAAGVVDAAGQVWARALRATDPHDPDQIEAAVADAVAELVCQYPSVSAVGAAAAGFVAPDRSTMLFAPN